MSRTAASARRSVDVRSPVDHRQLAAWPYDELDVSGLRASGWTGVPVRDVVLKVHQRCNLACAYCYVYTQADQSWRDRPKMMPDDVRQAAVAALGRHVRRHGLSTVSVILHGGEPLLYGATRLADLAHDIRRELPADCTAVVGVQTNGVLLDDAAVAVLRDAGIRIAVSVDGTAADHDRVRSTVAGRGSFTAVQRALDRLRRPENRDSYAGLLCVVDPTSDPVSTLEQLLAFDPPAIDFLLPHANWAYPPARPSGVDTAYGDWLSLVFDRWYDAQSPVRVRLFDDVIALLLGGSGRCEQVGLSPVALAVVETDGAIEQVDALKTAYDGAAGTGLDIRRDEFDALLHHPGVVARQLGRGALADACLTCPVVGVCGGGHYAHRYVAGAGFRNRSVYCEDLRRFIDHVRHRVARDIIETHVVGTT